MVQPATPGCMDFMCPYCHRVNRVCPELSGKGTYTCRYCGRIVPYAYKQ